MEFWKKNKWKIIAPVLIVLVLAAAFVFGDRNMPKQKDPSEQPTITAPVETPEQDASTADVPDDVETKPVENRRRRPQKTSQSRLTTRRRTNLRRRIPSSQNTFRRRKFRPARPVNTKK